MAAKINNLLGISILILVILIGAFMGYIFFGHTGESAGSPNEQNNDGAGGYTGGVNYNDLTQNTANQPQNYNRPPANNQPQEQYQPPEQNYVAQRKTYTEAELKKAKWIDISSEAIVSNLKQDTGTKKAVIRLNGQFLVSDDKVAKAISEREAIVKDTILSILMSKTEAELTGVGGKEQFGFLVVSELNAIFKQYGFFKDNSEIMDVFFKEYMTQ